MIYNFSFFFCFPWLILCFFLAGATLSLSMHLLYSFFVFLNFCLNFDIKNLTFRILLAIVSHLSFIILSRILRVLIIGIVIFVHTVHFIYTGFSSSFYFFIFLLWLLKFFLKCNLFICFFSLSSCPFPIRWINFFFFGEICYILFVWIYILFFRCHWFIF